MAEPVTNLTPRDFVRLIFRRKHVFWISACVFAIAGLIGAHYWPVKYTGTTKFERRSDAAAGETLKGGTESFETVKLTLTHELVGLDAIERVVDQLGLTRGLPRDRSGRLTRRGEMMKDDMVRKLQRATQVDWEVKSEKLDLVAVSVTHSDPKLAKLIPDMLVKNYISRVSEQIIQRLSDSLAFLKGQVRDCSRRLQELTIQKVQFEAEHAGMMPEDPGALQERIQQIMTDLDTLRRQQNMAKQTLARLQGTQQTTTNAASQPTKLIRGPNPELARLKAQLQRARDSLDTAMTVHHMTDQHPTVITLRQKIAQLEKRIAETPREIVLQSVYEATGDAKQYGAAVAAAVSEIEITSREIDRLERRLAKLQQLQANFAPIRQDYLQIVDKVKKQQEELDRWRQRMTNVQMALAAEAAKRRTHLSTVQSAREQFRPSSPKLWAVLGLVAVGSLAFGAAMVFLANILDRSIKSVDEAIEYFGIEVHGVIAEIVTPGQRARQRLRKWTLGPIVALVVIIALSLSSMSIILRLRYPDEYQVWRTSPVSFVGRLLTGGLDQGG